MAQQAFRDRDYVDIVSGPFIGQIGQIKFPGEGDFIGWWWVIVDGKPELMQPSQMRMKAELEHMKGPNPKKRRVGVAESSQAGEASFMHYLQAWLDQRRSRESASLIVTENDVQKVKGAVRTNNLDLLGNHLAQLLGAAVVHAHFGPEQKHRMARHFRGYVNFRQGAGSFTLGVRSGGVGELPKVTAQLKPVPVARPTTPSGLAQVLAENSLVEAPQPGDGSCQFHSLEFGLGLTKNSTTIRGEIVDELLTHPQRYKDFVAGDYGGYCCDMGILTTWGDHVTLQAAANIYRRKITVFRDVADALVIEPNDGVTDVLREELLLMLYAEVHYNALFREP